jgi:hypothetical protein
MRLRELTLQLGNLLNRSLLLLLQLFAAGHALGQQLLRLFQSLFGSEVFLLPMPTSQKTTARQRRQTRLATGHEFRP